MYLIYKTDNWHSYASRNLIGVVDDYESIIVICREQAEKEGFKIDEDQVFNLNTYNQTQGYKGEGEFHVEYAETNILL